MVKVEQLVERGPSRSTSDYRSRLHATQQHRKQRHAPLQEERPRSAPRSRNNRRNAYEYHERMDVPRRPSRRDDTIFYHAESGIGFRPRPAPGAGCDDVVHGCLFPELISQQSPRQQQRWADDDNSMFFRDETRSQVSAFGGSSIAYGVEGHFPAPETYLQSYVEQSPQESSHSSRRKPTTTQKSRSDPRPPTPSKDRYEYEYYQPQQEENPTPSRNPRGRDRTPVRRYNPIAPQLSDGMFSARTEKWGSRRPLKKSSRQDDARSTRDSVFRDSGYVTSESERSRRSVKRVELKRRPTESTSSPSEATESTSECNSSSSDRLSPPEIERLSKVEPSPTSVLIHQKLQQRYQEHQQPSTTPTRSVTIDRLNASTASTLSTFSSPFDEPSKIQKNPGSATPETEGSTPERVATLKYTRAMQCVAKQEKSVKRLREQLQQTKSTLEATKRNLQQSHEESAQRSRAMEQATAKIFRERLAVEDKLRKELRSNQELREKLAALKVTVERLTAELEQSRAEQGTMPRSSSHFNPVDEITNDLAALKEQMATLTSQFGALQMSSVNSSHNAVAQWANNRGEVSGTPSDNLDLVPTDEEEPREEVSPVQSQQRRLSRWKEDSAAPNEATTSTIKQEPASKDSLEAMELLDELRQMKTKLAKTNTQVIQQALHRAEVSHRAKQPNPDDGSGESSTIVNMLRKKLGPDQMPDDLPYEKLE